MGMVKTLFFDFGGCLDAPGIHTRTLFWEAFARAGLSAPEEKGRFQDAYGEADRRMMASGEAKELGLKEFNRWNGGLIAGLMGKDTEAGRLATDAVTEEMTRHLVAARPVLEELFSLLPLGLISNFTGNLEVILREHGLRNYFSSVTESFYEGCSKPDPRIFHSALAKQPHPAGDCLFVGDNPVNDIAPAKALGIRTVLIHCPGQKRDCGADAYIERLEELVAIVRKSQ